MKKWETVFKSLANLNRLEIVKMLSKDKHMNVGEITDKLKISYKSTSQHLILLKRVGVLEDRSQVGHVFYYINPDLSQEFSKALKLFV